MSDNNKRISNFYVVGGTLQPDADSYIERKADKELYKHIMKGDFCYVLTPRQMGKSSLMARTSHLLKKQGIQTVIIDLTEIGTSQEKESQVQWYYGIAHCINQKLNIHVNLLSWWKERENLLPLQRLTEFFNDVVLKETNEKVVIFIDEIDTTITLPFTDDFFATIRACYNARASQPEYQRLSFVLLGVATPSQLIKDTRRTPFNIGQQIDLTDFTFEEAEKLSFELGLYDIQREKALKRILYWTGGHPFLTQKLCRIVLDEKIGATIEAGIDTLVKKHFLDTGVINDNHLKDISDRLLQKKSPEKKRLNVYQQQNKTHTRKLLKIYRRIYRGQVITDEPLSSLHQTLKLSGIVIPLKNRRLSIRNPIYEKVFTLDWVKDNMPVNWKRNISIVSGFVLVVFITWYFYFANGLIKTINSSQDKPPLSAYRTLKQLPGYAGKANSLMANYWDRRALQSEVNGKRDYGLLYRLKALKVKKTDNRWHELGMVLEDYRSLVMTYPHKNRVLSVAFSPNNGKYLLTGDYRGMARLWITASGKLFNTMKHEDPIKSMAFSPDGKKVITGSLDGTAHLWWVDTGKPVGESMKHEGHVNSAAFSPDGKNAITGGSDGTVRLWQANSGKPLRTLIKLDSWVNYTAFSPDGKTVLTVSADGIARLWQGDTGKPLRTLSPNAAHVSSAAFSPDGKTVITGSSDGTVQLWHVDTGKPLGAHMKHISSVSYTAFSPDGKSIITGTDSYIYRGILTGKEIKLNASRVLPGILTGACRFLNDKGNNIQLALKVTGDFIRIYTLRFDDTDSPSFQGDPRVLLEQWQKKLALKLNEETGKIVPVYLLEQIIEHEPSKEDLRN